MNRVMIRLLSLSLLLTVAIAAPAAAKSPIVGVGDQHATMFADPSFQQLGVRHSRYVLAWDWYRNPGDVQYTHDWMLAAQASGISPLVAFNRNWAADLISKDVAEKVGKVWGLGSNTTKDPGPWEGEQRNMWKPTQQNALWFHGGNLHQSRHYSQYLALQLKARMEGIPTPVYGLEKAHHVS